MAEGPCTPWPLMTSCLPSTWPADRAAMTDAQRDAHDVASELLWRLTAGRFGPCVDTVRPCGPDCASRLGLGDRYSPPRVGPGFQPTILGGRWLNIGCDCSGPCGCGPLYQVTLPGLVQSVQEVLVDGAVLPATSWRLQAGRYLLRVDGQPWPICQRLDLDTTESDTWSITYTHGREVPAGGRRAVTLLAVEINKACTGQQCKLPQRVQQVVREGVTMAFLDPLDFLKQGRTGIVEIDLWLAAVNPTAQHSPSQVWTPDRAPKRLAGDQW